MPRLSLSPISALAAALFIVAAAAGAARSEDVPVSPELPYFESLGEVLRVVPLEGEGGYASGVAHGAAIRFSEEFVKTSDHLYWVLHTPRVEGGPTGDRVCHKGEECTLWIPPFSDPFPVPDSIPRTR